MADTVVSGAVVSPHDEGLPSISDGDEDWASSGLKAIVGQGVPSASYVRSDSELTFSNHDASNDQVDVTAGIAYLELAGETWNVQSTRGGSTPPNYDTAITADTMPAIAVVVPSAVSNVDLQDSALSDVWLAYATDGTVNGVDAGDVYIRSDDTGAVSAPSHPSVKLGQANPDDASADVLENRGPVTTFQELTVGGRFTGPAVSISSATTTDGEGLLFCDTSVVSFTLTLGSADALLGHAKRIRVTGSNTLTIDTEGSEEIDGGSSISITQDDAWVEVASDGSDWFTDRNRDLTAIATDLLIINQVASAIGWSDGDANQTIASGTVTKVEWESIDFEDDEVVDVTLGDDEVDVKVAGKYEVKGFVMWDSFDSDNRASVRIFVNGSEEKRYRIRASSSQSTTGPIPPVELDLDVDDTIDIRVFQDRGGGEDLMQGSSFAEEFAHWSVKRTG